MNNNINNNTNNNTNNSLLERFMKLNLYFKLMIVGVVLFVGSFVFDFVVKTASGFRSIKSSSKRSLSSNIVRNKPDKLAVEKIDKEVIEVKPVIEAPIERRFYNNNIDNLTVLDPVVLDDKKLARIRSSTSIKFNSDSREDNNNFKKYDLSQTIEKGKIIPCILNSYVSSNVGGRVEAIVSQDIFSKEGNNILIPKGSKIFGLFKGLLSIHMNKIVIEWENLHLPDGHVIKTLLRGVDSFGQDGHKAKYKYEGIKRILSYTVSSGVDLGLNVMGDKLKEALSKNLYSSSLNDNNKVLNKLIIAVSNNETLNSIKNIINTLPLDSNLRIDLLSFFNSWNNDTDKNTSAVNKYLANKIEEAENNMNGSYVQSAVNNLSSKLQNEIKTAVGSYEDFFYKNLSSPIQIVVDDYIVFPDSYLQNSSRGLIIL